MPRLTVALTRFAAGSRPFSTLDTISVEPQEFIPVGDHVVVPTRQRFRSKAGVAVEQEITQVLQFRAGRVIYATGFRDRINALKAVGLPASLTQNEYSSSSPQRARQGKRSR